MLIKTDYESNRKSLVKLKFTAVILIFLFIFFSIIFYSCSPKGPVEAKINEPPTIYNAVSNQPVPSNQQLLVPLQQFKANKIKVNSDTSNLFQSLGDNAWISPTIQLNYPTGQFYLYIDYAGKQDTLLDTEYYIQPICHTKDHQTKCLALSNQSDENYLIANTKENTEYQTIVQNKSWFYYAYNDQGHYLINPQEKLNFLVNAKIPEGYQPSWFRITMSEYPISTKKISFLLTQQYINLFKLLLILLPFVSFYGFYNNNGFSNRSALSIGLGIALWMVINVIIWDINYMVIGCLCIAFAGVLYMSGYWLYLIMYLLGYITIAQGAHEEFGAFNKDFFMKIGLITIIGFLLLLKERSK